MFLKMFGIGAAAALAGAQTNGTVTEEKTCYWFKSSTRPIRKLMGDGAVFPHVIHFTSEVDDKCITGRRFVYCTDDHYESFGLLHGEP